MRVILDTNILISAIISETSLPGQILGAWHKRRFELISSLEQIDEIKRVPSYPHLIARLGRSKVGRIINELREVSELVSSPPVLDIAPDPFDNFLLAMAQVSRADYLVSGDKADLLILVKHRMTSLVSARQFGEILGL